MAGAGKCGLLSWLQDFSGQKSSSEPRPGTEVLMGQNTHGALGKTAASFRPLLERVIRRAFKWKDDAETFHTGDVGEGTASVTVERVRAAVDPFGTVAEFAPNGRAGAADKQKGPCGRTVVLCGQLISCRGVEATQT